MHKVLRAHLEQFKQNYAIEDEDDRAFEAFSSFVILRSMSSDSVDPSDLVYRGDDSGIDSIMVFFDDEYVASTEEADAIFKRRMRDIDVSIILIQAKTSEKWRKSDINNFESAALDFFDEEQEYPISDFVKNQRDLFDKIIENVGRVHSGKPRVFAYFATSAPSNQPTEISAAFRTFQKSLKRTGFFSGVETRPLCRDEIIDLWNKSEGPIEAKLPIIANAPFPKTKGIQESYVLTARAPDFVESILSDDNGNLRPRVFEENVRDFIGLDEDVNGEIAATLRHGEKKHTFGVLNNGITIVSPDVRVQSYEIYMKDYQIVNGCQTSHILYELQDFLDEDVTLTIKVIEAESPDIIDDIVRSTNRQTKVQDSQFLATLDAVKAIERYFNARGQDEEHRLFFERRKNQYGSVEAAPAIRVFDIKDVARAAGAMFFDRPDLACRYPNRLTSEMCDIIFSTENREEIFYTAAYASYRLHLHLNNKRIDPKFRFLKWHTLMALRHYILGRQTSQPSSKKVAEDCEKIDKFMRSSRDKDIQKIRDLVQIFEPVDEITRDKIKGQTFVNFTRTKALSLSGRVKS